MDKPAANMQNEGQAGRAHVYLISLIAAVGGFIFGYDLNIIAGAQIYLKDTFQLTDAQYGFAMSSALLGCMAGPLVGGWFCDWIGRKRALIIAAVLFGVSAIGTALPPTGMQWLGGRDMGLDIFNIFRIVCGVGIGIASVASPMYIAEIAPARIRGMLVNMNQFAIVIGSLAAIVVAFVLDKYIPEQTSWRWMFGSALVPSVFLLLAMIPMADTPRWFARKGRDQEARDVLTRINGRTEGEKILDEIKLSLASEQKVSWGELFQPGIRFALLIGVVVAMMGMLTGWSIIAFYMPTIFMSAGSGSVGNALFQTILANTANVIFTIVGMVLVDRVGRRPLYLVGTLGMAVATFCLGLVFIIDIPGWLVVVIVMMCAWPHEVALGTLTWLLISEIFPTRVRALAMSLCACVVWIAGWGSTYLFPTLIAFFKEHFQSAAGVFWIFTVICILSFFFVLTKIPETKGRTLEDIAEFWRTHRGARASKK